jgi:hypothetical protein
MLRKIMKIVVVDQAVFSGETKDISSNKCYVSWLHQDWCSQLT